MKFLFQLLAILGATLTLAAPAPAPAHLQRPLSGSPQHQTMPQDDVGHTTTTPVSTHTHPNERPKAFQLPYVVKAPKTDRKHSKSHSKLPSWLKWKTSSASTTSSRMHFHHAGDAKLACFCAGGAICCHTATGLDCNSGYCGI